MREFPDLPSEYVDLIETLHLTPRDNIARHILRLLAVPFELFN